VIGPLTGTRVVELGGIGPAPFCAMLLADLGADVVRIHRPGDAAINPVLDRGRRSLAVDLKVPRGRDLVRTLAERADVVLEGFRPGVAERLGFDPATLRAANPALVFGRMTGFGQDGPLAQSAGHDINYIALSGALAAIGRQDQPPTPPLNLVGDFGGGGMLLAVGVLAAVIHARATGEGQDVDASMVEGSALLMAMIHGYAALGSWSTTRGDNTFDSGAPFYDTYACADGRYVAVGAIEPQFFATLVEVLGVVDQLPEGSHRDRETWPTLRKLFADAFATATQAEWVARFAGVDACVTPVLDLTEAPLHPHNVARSSFLTDPDGVVHPAPAPRFGAMPAASLRPTPGPGQHTDEILAELGHDAGAIAFLRTEGVVT
jgi:alpha-methylacyl-CoA racemase